MVLKEYVVIFSIFKHFNVFVTGILNTQVRLRITIICVEINETFTIEVYLKCLSKTPYDLVKYLHYNNII